MRILITGALGFVGNHFIGYLTKQKDPDIELFAVDRFESETFLATQQFFKTFRYIQINLLDSQKLYHLLKEVKPEYILHLASFSSVSFSWENPVDSFVNNTNIFLNLVDSVRSLGLKTRILSVGSSEEYQEAKSANQLLTETMAIEPKSPYAVARVAQEHLSSVYVNGYGLDIVLTRSFNHLGPGQDSRFFVPSILRQVIDLKKKKNRDSMIKAGNLSLVRDFVDVRDVCKAYFSLLLNGRSGQTYNVCSGRGLKLRSLVESVLEIAEVKATIIEDESLFRAGEKKIIIGDNCKIFNELGWKPEIPLEQSLRDMMKAIDK